MQTVVYLHSNIRVIDHNFHFLLEGFLHHCISFGDQLNDMGGFEEEVPFAVGPISSLVLEEAGGRRRKGKREGGSEGGREAGRQGEREGGREAGREGGRK